MLIRWATKEDKSAWLALSREYDAYIDSDLAQWYDGFDAYMDRKIVQRGALIAEEHETCMGAIAISRSHNRITFFGISHAAAADIAEALLSAALNELDTSREITINAQKGDFPKLQNEKRFLESQGFTIYDDTVLENGCPMYGMRRLPAK